jgi:hypothetical protein
MAAYPLQIAAGLSGIAPFRVFPDPCFAVILQIHILGCDM